MVTSEKQTPDQSLKRAANDAIAPEFIKFAVPHAGLVTHLLPFCRTNWSQTDQILLKLGMFRAKLWWDNQGFGPRLRCSGNDLRDLVPAYVNNPG